MSTCDLWTRSSLFLHPRLVDVAWETSPNRTYPRMNILAHLEHSARSKEESIADLRHVSLTTEVYVYINYKAGLSRLGERTELFRYLLRAKAD